MIDLQGPSLFLFSALFVLVSYKIRLSKARHGPYAPGPPPMPILGNVFDIPFTKSWIKYLEWSKQFNSEIIHLSAANTHIVVMNTMESAVEVLERRSANYSSRPQIALTKLLGVDYTTVLLPYGNALRKHRKVLDEGLKKDIMPLYHHVHTEKVHLMLDQLLHEPAKFRDHCETLGAAVTMAMAYGYDLIPGQRDHFAEAAEFAAGTTLELMLPGRTLISVFGFLRHIPPWFPAASTQRLGAEVKKAAMECRNGLFQYVKDNIAAGTSKDCILVRLLERRVKEDGSYEDEEIMKDVMATLYLGGVETMKVAQAVFILAMTLHPVEQKKAQEEIDRVVGSDRLPTFDDRASLPYVEALYREVLRWRPVAPLSMVHTTLRDDHYKGFFIPEGSFVFGNVWAITRNEEVYPNPESFQPERFLKQDGSLNDDTVSYAFGFGRRVCSGRHMADKVVWLMVVSVLATFCISKAKDEYGNEIEVDSYACTDGISSEPLPFKCSIVPRSREAESLVKGAAYIAMQSLHKARSD